MFLLLLLGAVSFLLSLGATPLVRNWALRANLVDQPDDHRKIHKHPIPRVGGVAIAVSYLATMCMLFLMPLETANGGHLTLPQAWNLLPSIILIFATGLIDDLLGLRPWQKLLGQIAASVLAYFGGIQIHVFRSEALDPIVAPFISILWLVGCTNAFNLIDGLDGLASGVGLFATITAIIAALSHGNIELALVTIPLAGSLLGFLRYNFNPASIFLGDCGSLLIGFLLGCYGVIWSQKSATLLGMTAPLMALSIPLLDAGLSVIRRYLRHQPIFGADRGHIHHQLLKRGMTPKRAALLMYGICGLAATLSLLQNVAHNQLGGLIVVLFCSAVWFGIQNLGYVEFAMAKQLLFKGTFRKIIDAQSRIKSFEQELETAATLADCWEAILRGCQHFGFVGVRLSIQGRIFEQQGRAPDGRPVWQLRIPLPNDQYINFYRDFEADLYPIVMSAFVRAIETALTSRLKQYETEVLTISLPQQQLRSSEIVSGTA